MGVMRKCGLMETNFWQKYDCSSWTSSTEVCVEGIKTPAIYWVWLYGGNNVDPYDIFSARPYFVCFCMLTFKV